MTFNDEKLAEVVSLSDIPIISAIGHETDTTIIDFVSDLRASTPTAAAELVVPVKSEIINAVKSLNQRMIYSTENIFKDNETDLQKLISFIKTPEQIIESFKNKLSHMNSSLKIIINNNIAIASKDLSVLFGNIKIPQDLMNYNKLNIKNLSNNLNAIIKRELINNKERYKNYLRLVETNSIQSNLKKGYSILSKEKTIINNSKFIKENDNINVKLLDRKIKIKVKKIN